MKRNHHKDLKRIALIVIGSLIMAANIKIFVKAGGLFPGGFTGITILIQRCALKYYNITLPYTPINLILNAFPAIISYKFIGKKFTYLSCLSIFLTSLFTDILPVVPLTYDVLLISIFGGMIMGIGIGICLQAEATSGGTDFIAIFVSQRYGVDAFTYILFGNIALLGIAGLLFGWDAALYSIIFQISSTEMVQINNKRFKRHTLIIVTSFPDEVADIIYDISHHGATRIHADGTYEHTDRPMIYSVVASDEVKKIVARVKKIDEHAFINVIKTDQVDGSFYMRPAD